MAEEEKDQRRKIEETRDILKKMIHAGTLPEVRAMTRSERRKMNDAGLNINNYKAGVGKNFNELHEAMCDWILDTIYPAFNFDQLPNNVAALFASYTYTMTYEDTLAEKN